MSFSPHDEARIAATVRAAESKGGGIRYGQPDQQYSDVLNSRRGALTPFRIYRCKGATPAATDWRRVCVHNGQAYGSSPDNSDSGVKLTILIPASTTGFKIWLATMRDATGVIHQTIMYSGCTAGTSGSSPAWSGGQGDKTGSGTGGWANYSTGLPYHWGTAFSNVQFDLIGTVDTTADSGTGAKKLTIHQRLTGDIVTAITPWIAGTFYQYLTDFQDTAYHNVSMVQHSVQGTTTTTAATIATPLTVSDGDSIWEEYTIDNTTHIGDVSAVTVTKGAAVPNIPDPTAVGLLPATFYLTRAIVGVDATAKTITITQGNCGNVQLLPIAAGDFACAGDGSGFSESLRFAVGIN